MSSIQYIQWPTTLSRSIPLPYPLSFVYSLFLFLYSSSSICVPHIFLVLWLSTGVWCSSSLKKHWLSLSQWLSTFSISWSKFGILYPTSLSIARPLFALILEKPCAAVKTAINSWLQHHAVYGKYSLFAIIHCLCLPDSMSHVISHYLCNVWLVCWFQGIWHHIYWIV